MSDQRFAGFIAIALCLTSTVVSAQRVTDIDKGVRVRITSSHGKTFSGSLVAASAESVTVLKDGAPVIRTTPSSDIARLEVSTGRHRGMGALLKGAIGLGIGVAGGALLGAASYSERSPSCFFDCTRGQAAAFGASLGGVAGLVFGTIVGVATGHESWTAVSIR